MHAMRLALPLLLLLSASPARADGSIDAMFGGRDLKNDAFLDPVDNPVTFGIVADFGVGPTLPMFLSVSASASTDSDGDSGHSNYTDLSIGELGVGVKLMPREGTVRPFFGGGALRSWVQETRNDSALSDSDTSKGWYVDTGATLLLGRHFNVGANIRWITGTKVELYGVKGDLDSRIFSVVGGFSWGDPPPQHHRGRE